MRHLLINIVAAIQALFLHRKYGVSGAYMEIVLRIEARRKYEHWSDARYQRELQALAYCFPDDVRKHLGIAHDRPIS